MKSIKFSDKHIEQIIEENEWSTLRTIKKENFYAVGEKVKLEGTDEKILIKDRYVLQVSSDETINLDQDSSFDPTNSYLAMMEGFDSYEDLTEWFNSRNYNLPQPMFLYIFDTDLNAFEETHHVQPQFTKPTHASIDKNGRVLA